MALYESLIDYIYGLLLIEKSGFFMDILCEKVLSVMHILIKLNWFFFGGGG